MNIQKSITGTFGIGFEMKIGKIVLESANPYTHSPNAYRAMQSAINNLYIGHYSIDKIYGDKYIIVINNGKGRDLAVSREYSNMGNAKRALDTIIDNINVRIIYA